MVFCNVFCARGKNVNNTLPAVTQGATINTNNNLKEGKEESSCEISIDDEPYQHLYRKKTKWELCRLSFTMMAIEIVYSLETALISPILLMYGMNRDHVVMIWALSPILGLVFSPLLGLLSDKCKFPLGRRRPFIIFLSVIVLLGLHLIAYSFKIGVWLGDKNDDIIFKNMTLNSEFMPEDFNANNKASLYTHTIVLIVVGTIMVDFGADALLNPSRAYVLDVCIIADHNKGLTISTIFAGIGGLIGYLLGSVNWADTFLCDIIPGGYIGIVFSFVAILFLLCITFTITSFKEMPLSKAPSTGSQIALPPAEDVPRNLIKDYLNCILPLPKVLMIVYLTNLFCWMSHLNFYFYFTHFVGKSVFNGDPSAPPDSTTYLNYECGIRFACFALALNCISTIVFPIYLKRLLDRFGIKYVYMGGILAESISLFLMTIYQTQTMSVILCVVSGVSYCTSFSIPYMLVAQYHDTLVPSTKGLDRPIRGLGTDISIIGTSVCVAQVLNAIYTSYFMTVFGVTFAVIGCASMLSCLAFFTASQIKI